MTFGSHRTSLFPCHFRRIDESQSRIRRPVWRVDSRSSLGLANLFFQSSFDLRSGLDGPRGHGRATPNLVSQLLSAQAVHPPMEHSPLVESQSYDYLMRWVYELRHLRGLRVCGWSIFAHQISEIGVGCTDILAKKSIVVILVSIRQIASISAPSTLDDNVNGISL